ncbi:putative tRNA wybutosine-synthesizing 1-like protein [Naja naja]|nr:putative tRNA wybutosine-synthesizing 1-like protein [Naja naja]
MDTPADTWDNLHAHLTFLWLNRFYLYSCAAFESAFGFASSSSTKPKSRCNLQYNKNCLAELNLSKITVAEKEQRDPSFEKVHVAGVKVFYGSQTGTAKISSQNICVFLVATYTDGKPTENAAWFCKWLEEAANDFRVGKAYLKGLRYAVSRNVDKWLWMLGARRILSCARGDGNVVKSQHGSIEADFEAWKAKLLIRLQALAKGEQKACSGRCKKGQCRSKSKVSQEAKEQETSEHVENEEEDFFETTSEEESDTENGRGADQVVDVEDLGKKEHQTNGVIPIGVGTQHGRGEDERREMITPALRDALTKQEIEQLQEHKLLILQEFFGVGVVVQHHTNPVGTEWRWKMDQPEMILKEAIENHQNLIKQFKGRSPWRERRSLQRRDGGQALCTVSCWGTNHVPPDQPVPKAAASSQHFKFFGYKCAVSRRN